MTRYYDANLFDELQGIRRRLLALEKAQGVATAGDVEGITGATPDGELPAAGSIGALYLVVASSGSIYRLDGEELDNGRAILLLTRVGRVKSG